MKVFLKRTFTLCISILLLLASLPTVVLSADTKIAADLSFDYTDFSNEAPQSLNGKNGVILSEGDSFSFDAEVEEGSYYIIISYFVTDKKRIESEIGLAIDREYDSDWDTPYRLYRIWESPFYESGFLCDNKGNNIDTDFYEIREWQTAAITATDFTGNVTPLSKGLHTFNFYISRGELAISHIEIVNVDSIRTYSEYLTEFNAKPQENSGVEPIIFEAENMYRKSSVAIRASFDRSSPEITPNDPVKVLYNLLDGGSYSTQGMWVEWKIDVEKSGYYGIAFKYRQNNLRGISVHRKIYVDGAIPYAEMSNLTFDYNDSFELKTIKSGEEISKIYLTEGEHIIRLEVAEGNADAVSLIASQISELNRLYARIIAVTGTNPDTYRDYEFKKEIPNLMDGLKSCKDSLNDAILLLDNNEKNAGSVTSTIYELVDRLEIFLKDENQIAKKLSSFRSQIDALADLNMSLKAQPLTLDNIQLFEQNGEAVENKKGFFKHLAFHIKAFMISFTDAYDVKIADGATKSLNLWVGSGEDLGRDQLQIIQGLIRDDFTPKTKIDVNAQLISSGIILQAALAGRAPDMASFVPQATVMQLAYREALSDLRESLDYEQMRQSVSDAAQYGFEYKDKVYAIAETQTHPMLFYRKDIFNEYGLKVPNTWKEFYDVAEQLQLNSMSVAVPADITLYETLLMQRGVEVYDKDLTKTMLDTVEAVESFEEWTDMFAKYDFPLSYDFFNRFRTGEMPMGITNYTLYKQIETAASELSNCWGMAPIPGTIDESGEIIRTMPCTVTGIVVLDSCNDKGAAYEYIKWWTSDSVQITFSEKSEALVGFTGRFSAANNVAFENIAWSTDEKNALIQQRKQLWNVKTTLAQYSFDRNLNNAFRRVLYYYEEPRDVLYRYNLVINDEIERKNNELARRVERNKKRR